MEVLVVRVPGAAERAFIKTISSSSSTATTKVRHRKLVRRSIIARHIASQHALYQERILLHRKRDLATFTISRLQYCTPFGAPVTPKSRVSSRTAMKPPPSPKRVQSDFGSNTAACHTFVNSMWPACSNFSVEVERCDMKHSDVHKRKIKLFDP
jgi:hypothetical protein